MNTLKELIIVVCVWMLVVMPMSTAFAAIDGLFHAQSDVQSEFAGSQSGGSRHMHASGLIHTHPIYNDYDRHDLLSHFSDAEIAAGVDLANGNVIADTVDGGSSIMSISIPVYVQHDMGYLSSEVYFISEIPQKLVSALIPTEIRPPIARL